MTPKEIIAEILDRFVDRPGHNMLAHEIIRKLTDSGYVIARKEQVLSQERIEAVRDWFNRL